MQKNLKWDLKDVFVHLYHSGNMYDSQEVAATQMPINR